MEQPLLTITGKQDINKNKINSLLRMRKDILEDKNIGVDMMNNLNNITIPAPTQVTVNSVEPSPQSRLPEKVTIQMKEWLSIDCI